MTCAEQSIRVNSLIWNVDRKMTPSSRLEGGHEGIHSARVRFGLTVVPR